MNVDIDLTNVVLKTERLTLRSFRYDDLADFNEYASVPGVGEMAGWIHHESMEESKAILERFIEHKKTFAIVYNDKVIGSVGIEKYNEDELPEFSNLKGREIGYVLSKDYWGRGFMTECVKTVIDYCFNTLDLDFLACGHFVDNDRSRRVQEKCGFVHYKLTKFQTHYDVIKDCWISILENKRNNR